MPDIPAAAQPGGSDSGGGSDSDGHSDGDVEDTLDLHLPDEFLALFRGPTRTGTDPGADPERPAAVPAPVRTGAVAQGGGSPLPPHSAPHPFARTPLTEDLLDGVGDWGPVDTPAGVFELVRVRLDRDLPVVSRWMNDPAVAAFWQLAGPRSVTEAHLRAQLDGDGRSVPCLGLIGGAPMSYWEIYRADLDPLARYYPARPHDTGVHLLLGRVADRGRGLGGILLRAVADLVLDQRAACVRVVAEPDLRNTPSVAAFLSAGFRFFGEAELPAKRAALVIRERSLRHRL
ncbi:GNAT family N-acetyltransferase [Streptomyces sp. NPDC046831]|uniref:GNAT family N-acetyltransferase n=1 Tax=Streptomyces sp. NPDC046831 TaxID=3154805 RepID=UPI0033F40BB5